MDVRNISITTFVLYIIHRNIQTVRERKKPFNSHICDANLYKKLSGQISLKLFMKERKKPFEKWLSLCYIYKIRHAF